MQIFDIISSISTAIASILILLTFIEMIRQRRALYRPEIIVENCTENELCEKPELIKNVSKLEAIEISGLYFIKIYNIGLGASKNIKINWDYNINALFTYINNNHNKKYKIKYYDNNKNIIEIKYDTKLIMLGDVKLDKLANIDHLLPANTDCTPQYIKVPFIYMHLLVIALNISTSEKVKEIIETIASLYIRIEYRDISDIKIIKKYKLKPNIFMIGSQHEIVNKIQANFDIELFNKKHSDKKRLASKNKKVKEKEVLSLPSSIWDRENKENNS